MRQNSSRLLDVLNSVGLFDDTVAADDQLMRVLIPSETSCRIEASEIAEMLRTAGASEPWKSPERCLAVVGYPVPSPDSQRAEHRAQNAVNELRRVLPLIIENEELNIGRGLAMATVLGQSAPQSVVAQQAVSEISDQLEQRLDNTNKLLNLLVAIEETPTITRRDTLDWHKAAIWLASYYKGIVGEFALSGSWLKSDSGDPQGGPAVRFIRAALKRLGFPEVSPDAVVKAVRLAGKKLPREKNPSTSADLT